jgi:hypothetical protein
MFVVYTGSNRRGTFVLIGNRTHLNITTTVLNFFFRKQILNGFQNYSKDSLKRASTHK